MFYLWFILQFTPPLIALWLHSKKSKEVYFTKESLLHTIADYLVMSFIITLFVYFVIYMNNPNEIVYLDIISGGKFQEAGFVFKYSVISLVSATFVGNFYSFQKSY